MLSLKGIFTFSHIKGTSVWECHWTCTALYCTMTPPGIIVFYLWRRRWRRWRFRHGRHWLWLCLCCCSSCCSSSRGSWRARRRLGGSPRYIGSRCRSLRQSSAARGCWRRLGISANIRQSGEILENRSGLSVPRCISMHIWLESKKRDYVLKIFPKNSIRN